jgi:transposase
MVNDTDATRLFGLEGVAVAAVTRNAEGIREVLLVTTGEAARACPSCGVFATRVKGVVTTSPRDLEHGGGTVKVSWRKRRWVCREQRCERGSFTEALPQIPAGKRLTERLRRRAGQAVADGGRTVLQAGRELGLSWPVVHRAFQDYAEQALDAQPAPTEAVGIDEIRRGKPVWKHNPATGKWELVADAWHVGFVDAIGGKGLFGQVEGRNAESVAAWLAAQPNTWRETVRYVAIDLCATFRVAVRTALPHATVVIDCFHIVQLAQRHLADLRRRLTFKHHGRRARKGDPVYTVRKLLRRNKEDLTAAQHELLRTELMQMGTYGRQIYEAWQAKELLRDLLRLTFKHAHTTPDRSTTSTARYRFQAFCADRPHLPELVTLAETVDQWWDGIEAYIATGITNAASEGNNRLIKLEARNAFGFRNRENQRLRSRCATTRRARREGVPG